MKENYTDLCLLGEGVAFAILSGSVLEKRVLFLKDPAGTLDHSGLEHWPCLTAHETQQ